MTSGVKSIDLRSNLIEKRYRGMKRAIQCFFLILPSYHTFGVNSECLRKNSHFLEIWPLVTSGDLNIDLTWKWPLQKLEITSQSIQCRLQNVSTLRSFRDLRGGPNRPPRTELALKKPDRNRVKQLANTHHSTKFITDTSIFDPQKINFFLQHDA